MPDQPRDRQGRYSGYTSDESEVSLGSAGFDLATAEPTESALCLEDMDHGADPRDYLDDEDTLVRISAASRIDTPVRETDRRVAEAIAA